MVTPSKPGWFWGTHSKTALVYAVATLVLDQANKWWMLDVYRIADKGRVQILPFLDFVFVKNTGISYSLFDQAGTPWQLTLAAFSALAALALWVWVARGAEGKLMAIAVGLIIGGALGNGIDRIRIGGVADFYSLHAFGYYWYVFNIADVAIVAGVAALLYESFLASRNDASKPL
jgi:signal peptidase II